MSNYNNVNRVLIGDGTNAGAITSIRGIQKGDLFLVTEKGVPVATRAAAEALPKHERVYIAAGVGVGKAILSSPIQGNTVSKYEGQSFVAPSERVVILGYNGTAGTSIQANAGNEYRLRVFVRDTNRFNGQRTTLADVNYVAISGSTLESGAQQVAYLYDQTDKSHNYTQDKIILERVSDGTSAALPTAAVVTGDKTVVITGHGLAEGDIVRIGGATPQDAVYIVSEVVDANTILLDVKYKGITATAAPAASLTAVTEWGFKLSGVPQESFIQNGNTSVDEYEWINFEAVYSLADDRAIESIATFTEVQALNPGQGYWKQVRDREEHAKGYLGDTSKRRFHDKRITSQVEEGQAYDSVVITHVDVINGDMQDTRTVPLKTEVYLPDGSDQGLNSGDNFVDVLNGFFGTVIGLTEITF